MRRRVASLACGYAAQLVPDSRGTVFAPRRECMLCSHKFGMHGNCNGYKIIPTLRQQITIPRDYHTKHRTEE